VKGDPTLWILARAAGITAYGLVTASVLAGLVLRSRPAGAMQEVEFYYPRELMESMRKADEATAQTKAESPNAIDPPAGIRRAAAVDPGRLNFAYDVSGPQVPWKPIRTFDDGTHVFIQMPDGMKTSDAPALLVAAGHGSQMVNYRVRGDYYVVDRLFDRAVLVSGVGREQDRVTIQYAGNAR